MLLEVRDIEDVGKAYACRSKHDINGPMAFDINCGSIGEMDLFVFCIVWIPRMEVLKKVFIVDHVMCGTTVHYKFTIGS